jgi:hypothetical protein
VYHLELRQFPHNLCRFNLSEAELHAVVEPWAREQWVELGERKWSPHQARLTVLEGPRMPLGQLSMGRGWRNAQRQCQDVTDRVLAVAKVHVARPTAPAGRVRPGGETQARADIAADLALQADSLGLELLSLLEHAPAPLSAAWRLASSRFPERPASECLALAEQAIRSLLQRRLIVLISSSSDAPEGKGGSEAGGELKGAEVEHLLRALESWAGEGERAAVRMRRT